MFDSQGLIIRSYREKLGKSQGQTARVLGYKNGQFVSNLERGLCGLPIKNIKKLCDYLMIPTHELTNAILRDKEKRMLKIINAA